MSWVGPTVSLKEVRVSGVGFDRYHSNQTGTRLTSARVGDLMLIRRMGTVKERTLLKSIISFDRGQIR